MLLQCNTHTTQNTHTWQHGIRSLLHSEQIDVSTVHQVHPGDTEMIYYFLGIYYQRRYSTSNADNTLKGRNLCEKKFVRKLFT